MNSTDCEDNKKTLRITQLNLLKEFINICEKNELRYFVHAGTLLGTIRDKGFIPWDPDVDVAMFRKDYDTLFSLVRNGIIFSEDFFIATYLNEKDHYSPHMIMYDLKTELTTDTDIFERKSKAHKGVYIDIFPLDFAPNDAKTQQKHANRIRSLKKLLYYKKAEYYKTNKTYIFLKNTLHTLMKIIPLNLVQKRLDKTMRKYSRRKTDFILDSATHYTYERVLLPSWVFSKSVTLPFESIQVLCPNGYDFYLNQYYGDYMKKPNKKTIESELKRVPKVTKL